jgi:hypothetical protein
MTILSFISMLVTFLRELVFDSKEELDYKSSNFNMRKMGIFLLIIALFISTILSTHRLFKQSTQVIKLKEAYLNSEANHHHEHSDYLKTIMDLHAKNIKLKKYINSLPESVKKSNPVPSDSVNIDENSIIPYSNEARRILELDKKISGNILPESKEEKKVFFENLLK